MGSSKKNKDRDKKKKKRERSRSKERERHRHHHKHKKHKRAREERSPSIDLSDLSVSDLEEFTDVRSESFSRRDGRHNSARSPQSSAPRGFHLPINSPPRSASPAPEPPSPPRQARHAPPPPPKISSADKDSSAPTSGKEVLSLSIEETNKIRAKLGLKPLSEAPKVKDDEDESTYKPGEEIHKPAQNLRDKLQVEKLREKIAAQREKRRQKDAFSKVKGLGESDDESTSTWVTKSRQIEKDRKEAEKRNKMLEELDAQFGVGDLVEEEMSHRKKTMYDTKHLSGLKVDHDTSRFNDGHSTILTLKDSNILDGEEDTLINVNIIDQEIVEKNLKRKRAKPDTVEYETPEIDEFGNFVQKELLTKYDEEIGGEKRQSFRIGSRGDVDRESIPAPAPVNKLAKLRKLTSLAVPETQLATEYLTPDDLVSFKKKKKRKKKKMLTADDLEPLPDTVQDHGSRQTKRVSTSNYDADVNGHNVYNRVKNLKELMIEEDDEIAVKMDVDEQEQEKVPGVNNDIELQEAVNRFHRIKSQNSKFSDDKINELLTSHNSHTPSVSTPPEMEVEDIDLNMTLNITDEFCRTLGDIPTYGLSGNRAEEDNTVLQSPTLQVSESKETQGGAWEEVDIEDTKVEILNEKTVPILEEEPDTGRGMANALRLAMKKGYLEKDDSKKAANATLQHLRAVHYSIEDKNVDDERRGRGDHRYMGPVMDFREKTLYKPDVKLEYVDDEGRKLNAKEAFRYLSHKFHGKGSGKNKLEKRMKKWKEELLMKHMSSSDTPLQTLERQREKQRQLGSAYLLLSGSKTQEPLEVKK